MNLLFSSIWQKGLVNRLAIRLLIVSTNWDRLANRLLIVSTNLDGFSFVNHG